MTDLASRTVLPLRSGRLGDRVAGLLLGELSRLPGPKSGLLVGVPTGCPVLAGALAGLSPGDTLTVLPDAGSMDAQAAVGDQVTGEGDGVGERVQVLTSLRDAKPSDVVIVAQPLSGSATDVAALLDELRELVAPGGVLVVAAPARPGDAAGLELRDLADRHGVGTDLVVRHRPPLRVHRLRFTPAEPLVADRLTPVTRPSSVPLAGGMNLDSNGVAAAAVCAGLALLTRRARPSSKLWLVPALAALPVAAFFRDPERTVPDDESAVVAASDGTVLSIEQLHDDKFGVGDGEWLRIAVFLSVLDVHINRAPVAGRVIEVFRERGGYAPAMKAAAEHNVAAYTVLESGHGPVVVAQRTGLVARRIVHRAPAGALIARGERFGLIRFGSRTDVYLPAGAAEALVAPGDKVAGGASVIARWR
ncbi:MAG: phosphatidylserine decarboxylase [Actinocatenispora sp.]